MVVALIGTLLPLVLGILCTVLLGSNAFPNGLSVGATLAPTSVGIALKLLSETKQLNSNYGQTIIAAAFGDDIIALIVMALLMNLAAGSITVWGVMQPIVASILFVAAGFFLALKVRRALCIRRHLQSGFRLCLG
jgi:Kef-type K+ transport system membrane component KefB